MQSLKITGVSIFLKKRKTQVLAGKLSKIDQKFVFTYEDAYLFAKSSIALGPEFPMTKKVFSSDILFPTLQDRIPSTKNPAYPEYCVAMGIDPKEKDPFILLSTIGSKGPSSFIFYPIFERNFSSKDMIAFRNKLGLTTREFAAVFELSQSALNAIERGRQGGADILKRLEVLLLFPEVSLYFLWVNRGYLLHERWIQATEAVKKLAQTTQNELGSSNP